MKILSIRLFIVIFSIFYISGCSSGEINLSRKNEYIQSFFIADDDIYAVGSLNTYRFTGKNSQGTPRLIKFLKSEYMKYAIRADIYDIKQDSSTNKVEVHELKIEINDREFTDKQRKEFRDKYGYMIYSGKTVFISNLYNGDIVTLQNRNEILKNGSLKEPISTHFTKYKFVKGVDSEKRDIIAMSIIALPIVVPFSIITLPFQLSK